MVRPPGLVIARSLAAISRSITRVNPMGKSRLGCCAATACSSARSFAFLPARAISWKSPGSCSSRFARWSMPPTPAPPAISSRVVLAGSRPNSAAQTARSRVSPNTGMIGMPVVRTVSAGMPRSTIRHATSSLAAK